MPLTSTWNIWTPDDADNYDFIVDSAATAQTVDDALTQVETDLAATLGAGANFYTGTASQRAAFLPTAAEGDTWHDTDGTRLTYEKRGAAWVVLPTGYMFGTSTQRAAQTPAFGMMWQDTDGSKQLWSVSPAGAWRLHEGKVSVADAAWSVSAAPAYGRSASLTIPTVLSPTEGLVIDTIDATGVWVGVSTSVLTRGSSNTTCTVYLYRLFNAGTTAFTLSWRIINVGS